LAPFSDVMYEPVSAFCFSEAAYEPV